MDITDVRSSNIKDILNSLRFTDGLTKKEISQITNLSFSTVSSTCNVLKEKQILTEEKVEGSGVGRMPSRIIFNKNQFCAVSLGLQNRNFLDFTTVSFSNDILYTHSYNITNCATVQDIIAFSHNVFKELGQHPLLRNINCAGIGISVPGIFDKKAGMLMNSSIPFFEKAPLSQMAEDTFNIPCYVDTESNFCAIALQQKMPYASNFIYINLAAETSAGVICQGNLVTGQSGHAIRISHLPLGNPDKKCSVLECGSYGCIHSEISLSGMVGEYLSKEIELSLKDRWKRLEVDIRKSPQEYISLLEEKGIYIGKLISTLVCLFDPATVYLGGQCLEIFELLQPFILAEVQRRCPLACRSGLQVLWDQQSSRTINEGICQVVYDGWSPLVG